MSSVADDFWCKILRCAAKCIGLACGRSVKVFATDELRLTIVNLLCKPEIDEFEMSISIDQNVLRLEISIRDAFLLVQELQDETYFCCVKL